MSDKDDNREMHLIEKNDESAISCILESHHIYGMNGTLVRKNRHFDITTHLECSL